MEILIVTGPPYSGKGTQCKLLQEKYGFNHISTGDRCRMEKENNTEIGKILSKYEEKGDLVPDTIIKELFDKIIEENKDEKAIILDGYPRTESQVDDLIDLALIKGIKIRSTIHIAVPREALLLRAKTRAQTSNRADDMNDEIHKKRIEVFEQITQSAINSLKSKIDFVECNGLGSIQEINEEIVDAVGKTFKIDKNLSEILT